MTRVVVIGDALIDEMRDDRGVREFVGGTALNVAVGLSVLGVPTMLLATVGEDPDGARIRSHLATFGVELLATPAPFGTGRAISERVGGAEPHYAFNATSRDAVVRIGDAEREAITAAPAVVVTGVPLDSSVQVQALRPALAAARILAVDPNPRAARLHDRAAFRDGLLAIANGATVVKVGDDDATLLGWASPAQAAAAVRSAGAKAVLTTLGANGAGVVADGVSVTTPIAHLPGRIVDTMGAGDATLSSVVHDLITDPPNTASQWQRTVEAAMLIAAATCRHEGALLRRPAVDGNPMGRIGT